MNILRSPLCVSPPPRPQVLSLRRLPPGKPAVPAADALTQLWRVSTELIEASAIARQARVPITGGLLCLPKVMLRILCREQGGL